MEIFIFFTVVCFLIFLGRVILRILKQKFALEVRGLLVELQVPEDFIQDAMTDDSFREAASIAEEFLVQLYPVFSKVHVVRRTAASIYLLWEDEQRSLGWHNNPRYKDIVLNSEMINWQDEKKRIAQIVSVFCSSESGALYSLEQDP